ncbi:MAG: flippase [Candidatus Margulisiibacteriota bacterium]
MTRRLISILQSYLQRPGIRSSAINSGWLLLDKLTRLVGGLIVGIWVARYLGPNAYGIFGYALSLSGIVGVFGLLGLDAIMVRWLVRYPKHAGTLLGSALVIRLLATTLCMVGLGLWGFGFEQQLNLTGLGLIGLGLLVQPATIFRFAFDAKLQSGTIVKIELTAYLLCALLKLGLIAVSAPLVWFIGVFALETVLGVVGIVLFFGKRFGLETCRFNTRTTALLFRHGLPLILTGSATMIYMRIDQVMLPMMSTAHEAGLYAAATRLSELWSFIPAAFSASAAPAIIRARQHQPQLYKDRLQRLASFLMLLAFGIIAVVSGGSRWLIPLLYGDHYLGAIPMLTIHTFGLIGIFQIYATHIFFTSEKLNHHLAVLLWGVALVNIGLNAVLLPRWGGIGAAVATAFTYSIALPVSAIVFKKTRPIFWMSLNALRLKGLFSKNLLH